MSRLKKLLGVVWLVSILFLNGFAFAGEVIRTLIGHSKDIHSVVFSSDGTSIISGSDDATIKLWNVQSGRLLYTLKGHKFDIKYVAFGKDSAKIEGE